MSTLPRLVCLASLLLMPSMATLAQSDSWKLPNRKANPIKSIVRSEWQDPARACSLLADIPGMQTRDYKNVSSKSKDCFCSSPFKAISEGWPVENNIAYYVLGDHNTASELKLVLNVNYKQTAQVAQTVLAVVSNVLTKRALGAALSEEVLQSLLSGNTGQWDGGKNQILIVREDWPSGRGYEMKFIIR